MRPANCVDLNSVICAIDGRILLDIDRLSIAHGERVAIVGHNGAGKSTLLRLLSGFMCPVHGTAEVLGRSLDRQLTSGELRALRREVGQVMQGLHLVQRLDALENVLIGCLGRRSGWRTWVRRYSPEDLANAGSALRAVGLLAKAAVRVDHLSGGERQKVALARMLMQGPRLILADEPTAALDPQAAAEVCALLSNAAAGSSQSSAATLVTVVHNPLLLPVLADRVIGLKQGRVAFDLPATQVDDSCLHKLYRADTPVGIVEPPQYPDNGFVMSPAAAL
ncbi:MAG: ATP-binding cassette domain-containing protein [Sterolibacterium sp.]|jgi:phosphonate transport system ATP-binding protein